MAWHRIGFQAICCFNRSEETPARYFLNKSTKSGNASTHD